MADLLQGLRSETFFDSVADPDPHHFGKLDPGPHQSGKQDLDPQQSEEVEA